MALTEKIRAIITGATGMVGEGVLLECLENPHVESVLIINRKPSGFSHAKLKEIVHKDFYNFEPIVDQLTGYNACYFCLGVSSVVMKEPEYTRVTYTLTLHVAGVLSRQNPGMVFCYVSGAGTDSTEQGRLMWARVKGKTENDLRKLPFKASYAFRPGVMKATEGQKNVLRYYKYFIWLYPILLRVWPNSVSTLQQVAEAMIKVTLYGYEKPVLEVPDVKALAARQYV
jgi:hypothetical protein